MTEPATITVPKHDKDTCERQPCRRCQPQGTSAAPKVPDNPHDHDRRPPAPPVRVDVFHANLLAAAEAIAESYTESWQRTYDWQTNRAPKWKPELDDDEQDEDRRASVSERDAADKRDEAQASRYHQELRTLTARIDADIARVRRIITISTPSDPRTLKSKELLAAQVAAEGYCVNCWTDDQHLEPITLRPETDPHIKAKPYYRDLCRACGAWKAEHNQHRPMLVLRLVHQGRRVTQSDVDRALGR